jgi:hypothetical protein
MAKVQHAKLFLLPLSLGGLNFFVKCTPEENVDFLSHKMTFLKKIFKPLVIFTNLQRNFQKVLNPSTPWNELAAPRTSQIIENGP